MADHKVRPSLSAPPSYYMPPAPPKRRLWQKLCSGHMRTLSIILLGTSVFLALHTAFGQLGRPSFHHVDEFPRKIWQSWKVDPLRFEDRDIKRARSWTGLNPAYRYEVLTDQNALPWVELHFGPSGFNRPDIVNTYKALENNLKIIQADLLRYLIMYAEGGVWTDIDVQALKPLDSFIPKGFDESDVHMIIGIETDEPDFKDHPVLGSKAQSFCQWTFVCKPRLPVMLKLIDNIQIWLAKLANEQGKDISQLHLGFDEVLSGTGPSAFTEAILQQMRKDTHRNVDWDKFHDMTDSILVGGVLVLPAEAFAAGTGHSKSGNHGSRRALVKHHFHASSWTTRHPRKKHPIYGEVERCNWDAECVKLWDSNTAFYSSLPEKDQQRMISIKRLREAEFEEPGKMGAQVPMGAMPVAPVEAPKVEGPPDLAAIAKFLGQAVEEAKNEPDLHTDPLAKLEAQETPVTPPNSPDAIAAAEKAKEAPIDLAAIAKFLGQAVEEKAAAPPAPAADLKSEAAKQDAIDLAAIAKFLGQVDNAVPATDAKAPVVDTKPVSPEIAALSNPDTLDPAALKVAAAAAEKANAAALKQAEPAPKIEKPKDDKKESGFDLKSWIKGSKGDDAAPADPKAPAAPPAKEPAAPAPKDEVLTAEDAPAVKPKPGKPAKDAAAADDEEWEDDEEEEDDEAEAERYEPLTSSSSQKDKVAETVPDSSEEKKKEAAASEEDEEAGDGDEEKKEGAAGMLSRIWS